MRRLTKGEFDKLPMQKAQDIFETKKLTGIKEYKWYEDKESCWFEYYYDDDLVIEDLLLSDDDLFDFDGDLCCNDLYELLNAHTIRGDLNTLNAIELNNISYQIANHYNISPKYTMLTPVSLIEKKEDSQIKDIILNGEFDEKSIEDFLIKENYVNGSIKLSHIGKINRYSYLVHLYLDVPTTDNFIKREIKLIFIKDY
jgi:hypothetical protein